MVGHAHAAGRPGKVVLVVPEPVRAGALLIDENERDGGNTASTGHNEYFLGVNGSNAGASYADGVQYSMMAITSSLMSDAEQLDFYETVRDYLIIPTGRN